MDECSRSKRFTKKKKKKNVVEVTQNGESHWGGHPRIAIVDDLLFDELTFRTVLIGPLTVGTRLTMAGFDHLESFALLALGTAAVVALLNTHTLNIKYSRLYVRYQIVQYI